MADNRKNKINYNAYIIRYYKLWLWGFLMLVLTNFSTMAIPQLFRYAIEFIQAGATPAILGRIAFTLVLVALGAGFFRVHSRRYIFFAGRDVERDIRNDYFCKLNQQDPSFFQNHTSGDLLSRATDDLTQVRLFLGPGLLNLCNTLIAYAVALPLMLSISVELSLLSFLFFPPAMLVMRQVGRIVYHRNRDARQRLGELTHVIQENLSGVHVTRSFANEAWQQQQFQKYNQRYYLANVRLAYARSSLFRLGFSVANVAVLVVLVWGSYEVIRQTQLSLGDVVALVEYMALLAWPTMALGWITSLWQRSRAALDRIEEILAATPQTQAGSQSLSNSQPDLMVSGLQVCLAKRILLQNISFCLPWGNTVGIVGPVGSGKTTLAKALLRLVDIPTNCIYLNSIDITQLNLDALRQLYGYIPQDTILFSTTIRNNICFAKNQASVSELELVMDRAQLTRDLVMLPQGIETIVGERGVRLSGGQKQRVAIARALLLDPPILLVDDAFSSLDSETEAALVKQLRKIRKQRSTIVISHRYTAVKDSNEILVLNDGQISEVGPHEKLIKTNGYYARMVQRQQLEYDNSAEGPKQNLSESMTPESTHLKEKERNNA